MKQGGTAAGPTHLPVPEGMDSSPDSECLNDGLNDTLNLRHC